MDIIYQILYEIPLFRHCTEKELSLIRQTSQIAKLKKNQTLDVSDSNSLYIVINGFFEIEGTGKNEFLYLSQGSLFGNIPFTTKAHRGNIRAITDSSVMILNIEELYKFFLTSFKALRGYMKIIDTIGFDISNTAKEFINNKCKIITTYSTQRDAGKTFLSAYLGLALSEQGNTLVLDMSYQGTSLFNIFEKKITPALSQKQPEQTAQKQFIFERIETVDNTLSLLNIVFGSKVSINPEIISPILFLLSQKFKYIIADLSDFDEKLRDEMFSLSDIVLLMIKRTKEQKNLYNLVDKKITEGQRIFYVLNGYYSSGVKNFDGGYIFDALSINKKSSILDALKEKVRQQNQQPLVEQIISRRKGLVLKTNFLESFLYSSVLTNLEQNELQFDVLYSSYFSYCIIAMYLISNEDDFVKRIQKLFTEERFNSLLDINFPEQFVFSNSKIIKFFHDFSKDQRIEFFKTVPIVKLCDENNERRMFSTGFMKDVLSASFLLYPIFESMNISGTRYHSGFPRETVSAEELFRTDLDDIFSIAINNKSNLGFKNNRLLDFYNNYLLFMHPFISKKSTSLSGTHSIEYDIDEKTFSSKKFIKLSKDISDKFYTNIMNK